MIKKVKNAFLKLLIKIDNGFLCDVSRLNHPSTCAHPERPNSKKCNDFEHKSLR